MAQVNEARESNAVPRPKIKLPDILTNRMTNVPRLRRCMVAARCLIALVETCFAAQLALKLGGRGPFEQK